MKKIQSLSALSAQITTLEARIKTLEARPAPKIPNDVARLSDIPPTVEPVAPQADSRVDGILSTLGVLRADLTETRQWLADMGRTWQAHKADVASTIASTQAPEMPTLDTSEIDASLATLTARVDAVETENDILRTALAAIPDSAALVKTGDIVDWSGEIEALITAIDNVSKRECPAVNLAPIESSIAAMQSQILKLTNRADTVDVTIPAAKSSAAESIKKIADELAGVRSAVQSVSDRRCPVVDLSGIEARIGAVESNQCPVVDLSGIIARTAAVEKRVCPSVPDLSEIKGRLKNVECRTCPKIPDTESIRADLAGVTAKIDEILGGEE